MKKLITILAAALCGNIWAATPVAVWDGDFNTSTKGEEYTLNLSTHTKAEDGSKVTIAAAPAQGMKIGWTTGQATTTVLVKHNGLPDYSRLTTLIALKAGGNEQRVGVNLKADRSFGTIGYWNGGTGSRAQFSTAMDKNPGVFAIKYKPTNDTSDPDKGTRLVEVVDGAVNERYYEAILMGAGDTTTGVVIGGNGVNNGSNYTGFEITGVAIFNTILSNDEIAAYQWPSEIVTFETNPPSSTEAARFRESTWKGTVWLKNMTVASFDLAQYGNANSTIRLTGFKGYSPNSNDGSKGFDGTVELVDEGDTKAWTITDTYGSTYYVAKLIGSGTFTTLNNKGGPARYAFKNVDGFTGSIDLANGGRSVTIGEVTAASDYVGVSGQNTIKILSGASATIATGKTWKAANGLIVDGTLTKEYGATASGTLSGSGEVIALGDSTAERALNQIGLSGLTAAAWTGTLTIKNWRGQADANQAKFGNFYGNAASTIRFDGYDGYMHCSTFNAVKSYDIAEGGLKIRGGYTNGNADFIGGLTGSGPITLYANGSQNATAGNVKFIGDVSGYTGTISFDNATTFRVAFLAATNSEVPAYSAKEVLIGAGVTAPQFTTTGAIHAMNGAILKPSVAIPAAGSAIIDNGAVVQLSEMPEYEVGTKIIALENAIPMALPVQATIKIGDREQSFYGLAQKTDGVYVVEQEELTWKGESGTAITAEGAWDAGFGGYADNAEYGKFVLPEGKTDCVIKVPSGTANVGLIMVKGGSYIFEGEGQSWQIGALLVSEGAAVSFKNIDVDILSSDVTDPNTLVGEGAHIAFPSSTISLTSGEMTVNRNVTLKLPYTPSFNSAATIKIADAATLAPGVYKLMSWEKADAYGNGYGLPKLDTTGYTPETNAKVRLVPEVKALWLQVQSAAQAARKPLVIMPWGDSITEGVNNSKTHANYRVPLFQKLSLAGYNVQSVGFWKHTDNADGAFNPAGLKVEDEDWEYHSGRGSERLIAEANRSGTFYNSWANALDQAGNPDIVTMHIGINDMLNNSKNLKAADAYQAFTNVIAKVMRERPETKFVISSPMCCEYGHSQQQALFDGDPNHRDVNKEYVKPLHDMIADFIKAVKSEEGVEGFDKSRLFFADMYEAVMPGWYANDPQLDLNMKSGGDHCHPTWVGHDIMAKTWFDQIVAAIPQDEQGDYDCLLKSQDIPADVDAEDLGAEANVPEDYLEGFKLVRKIELAGTEKTAPDLTIPEDTEKVGYFVEYVFPSATTNIHRWVWVDKPIDSATGMHVVGNHPAVINTAADETIDGSVVLRTENGGAFQIHRNLPADELDRTMIGRTTQLVFAYNGWNDGTDGKNDFGIGNFAQHFQGKSADWTGMGQTETMNASVLESKTIEIWVKLPKQIAAKIGDTEYETLEDAIKDLKNGATLTLQSDIELDSTLVISSGTHSTIDLNGHAITASGTGEALAFASGSEVTVTGEGSITAESGLAITSAGLTTISGTKGIPVIGGAKVTKGSASKLSVDEAFLPETPLVVDYDWTGTFMNSTMPRLAIAHTSEASYATRAKYNFNPIREVGGVVYAATMSGGADTNPGSNLHIFMVDYCYTVNEATIEIEHATIPYVFGVVTDTSTGKMYTLKEKVMMVMGQLQYTTVTPEDISFQLQVESGYQNPSVVANGETIEPNEKGYYHIRPGATGTAITITAEKIPTTPTYDEVTEDTPIEDIVPGITDKQLAVLEAAGVKATDIATWAKEKGGIIGSTEIGGAINLEAFALNCSPEELATEEENFKVSIEIAANGTIIVSAPEGYNVTPVIKGKANLSDEDWAVKTPENEATLKFFKAFIEL